jgi:hypothetical protein
VLDVELGGGRLRSRVHRECTNGGERVREDEASEVVVVVAVDEIESVWSYQDELV